MLFVLGAWHRDAVLIHLQQDVKDHLPPLGQPLDQPWMKDAAGRPVSVIS